MANLSYSDRAIEDVLRLAEFAQQTGGTKDARRVMELVVTAINILADHPNVGRFVDGYLSELVISRGRTGYVALYRFDEDEDVVRILAVRHQREAGF